MPGTSGWRRGADGGTTTRLTARPGLELFQKFSPGGQCIAFMGQHDGDEQVYIILAGGGLGGRWCFRTAPPRQSS